MELKMIKKIRVMPFALTMGILYGVIGLVIGILALFIGAFLSFIPSLRGIAALEVIVIIIIYPVLLFIIGFVSSAIMAIMYNFVAPRVGGIQVEVE